MPAGLARGIAFTVAALSAAIVLDAALHVLMAQNPFGGPRPAERILRHHGVHGGIKDNSSR